MHSQYKGQAAQNFVVSPFEALTSTFLLARKYKGGSKEQNGTLQAGYKTEHLLDFQVPLRREIESFGPGDNPSASVHHPFSRKDIFYSFKGTQVDEEYKNEMEEITSVKFQETDEKHVGYKLSSWIAKEAEIKNSHITYSTDGQSQCGYVLGFSGKFSEEWESPFCDLSSTRSFKNSDESTSSIQYLVVN